VQVHTGVRVIKCCIIDRQELYKQYTQKVIFSLNFSTVQL